LAPFAAGRGQGAVFESGRTADKALFGDCDHAGGRMPFDMRPEEMPLAVKYLAARAIS
jgi:hypothetical protein